jgi:aryl-alcohol dehydrogenase
MAMIAAVTESRGEPFVLTEVEVGELRADEVLVAVHAAGICHTDLICRDQWIPVPLPAVLGHEGAGVVIDVGAGVRAVHVGERVGLSFDSCGLPTATGSSSTTSPRAGPRTRRAL